MPVLSGNEPNTTEIDYYNVVDKLNINIAIKEELMLISGIGEKKAEAIISYRTLNGHFKDIQQLKSVKGISANLFDKIKQFITI